MIMKAIYVSALVVLSVGLPITQAIAAGARESARAIPVAYDVDVVVVGGSSAAVTAAVEAAECGAEVFLAAPRPYLGEDICGTYRLWLEPGEEPVSPLAKTMFAEPPAPVRVGPSLPFTYESDVPSTGVHKDTDAPSKLSDGKWASAYKQSVEYSGDVTIVADLKQAKALGRVHVMAFQRHYDIEVASVTVWISDDRQQWKHVAEVKNDALGQGDYLDSALVMTAPINATARYVKLLAKKTPNVERLLLGEIVIESAETTVRQESASGARRPPMPMQIKRALDQALLDADVQFLYGCYVTDVVRDADGNLAGVVMANRSGRQAVKASVIIDATLRATVARIAGAEFSPYPAGPQSFVRVVVGGELHKGDGILARKMPTPVQVERSASANSARYEAIEYTLAIPMKDATIASFAEAEQVARDRTWDPGQMDASEFLFQVPPDPMKGRRHHADDWPGAAKIDLDVFKPAGRAGLYVLGGCADVSRQAAARLLRPLEFMAVGRRIGRAAAKDANARPKTRAAPANRSKLETLRVVGAKGETTITGDIREMLVGVRPTQHDLPTIPSGDRLVPVLGVYDVVVVGGGTGGAPAGIAAARQGARTLVLEFLHGLGGVGTLGLIGKYYHGYRGGFTAEVDKGLAGMDGKDRPVSPGWNVEWKMEWYRRELRKAGADVWFGTLGCGALVDDGRVKGVVVATSEGRGVVLASVVVDSTGNSDIAAAAGAKCIYTDGSHVAVQGTGLPPRKPGASYTNTDYTLTDDSDLIDMWRSFIVARAKFENSYDLSQLIDTRERRRIVGDFVISPLDVYNGRKYPDTIGVSKSNFDTHGYTVHPLFTIKPADKQDVSAYTPYRSLLPTGLDGILVTGLGISAHRDAMPILRMQPDIQNQGYAAGVAASMAARAGKGTRRIDIKALQQHLIEKGNLSVAVLTDKDNFPASAEQIAAAVKSVADDYRGIGLILAQPKDALPLLRKAYPTAATAGAKLVYAHILGMLGDATGAAPLAETVRTAAWDSGWNFTGGGQFGASLSPLDSWIIALGNTRDPRALGPILEKVQQLGPTHAFSHHRAAAVALETLGNRTAAKPLAELLKKSGMTGYALTHIEDAKRSAKVENPNLSREQSLRELILARALYRCGDYNGLGERILKEYRRDFRGHHARHASAILAEKQK